MNTRTSASFGINGQFNMRDYFKSDKDFHDNNNIRCSFNGGLNYYFSPRLRAFLNTAVVYSKNENENKSYSRNFSFTNQIGINYALF